MSIKKIPEPTGHVGRPWRNEDGTLTVSGAAFIDWLGKRGDPAAVRVAAALHGDNIKAALDAGYVTFLDQFGVYQAVLSAQTRTR